MTPSDTFSSQECGRVLRFFASGAANTLLTYGAYLGGLSLLTPVASYSIAYALGIGLAYFFNRFFVFRAHAGWRSALATPAIYLLQYLLSMVIVALAVRLGVPPALAPLPAIVVCVPLNYLLTRASFMRRRS